MIRRSALSVGIAVLVVVAASCTSSSPVRDTSSDSGTSPASAHGSAGSVTGSAPPVAGVVGTTGTARPRERASYAVGTLWHDFVDEGRGRTLRTLLHYPAAGPAGSNGSTPADGSFPIVLMAHGYRLPAAGYERILTALSESGYITVSPAFPRTSAEVGDGLRADIVNQPRDLSFVLDQVIQLAATPDSPLPSVAQPDRVGAMGHSDGGLTISALAFNAQFHDPRIVAAVVMTGGRALFPGSYFDVEDPPALLAVHGTADGNPYSGSKGLVTDAAASDTPAFLVTVEGGGHIDPYMFDTALPELADAVVAFMDEFLRRQPDSRARLQEATRAGGLKLEPE